MRARILAILFLFCTLSISISSTLAAQNSLAPIVAEWFQDMIAAGRLSSEDISSALLAQENYEHQHPDVDWKTWQCKIYMSTPGLQTYEDLQFKEHILRELEVQRVPYVHFIESGLKPLASKDALEAEYISKCAATPQTPECIKHLIDLRLWEMRNAGKMYVKYDTFAGGWDPKPIQNGLVYIGELAKYSNRTIKYGFISQEEATQRKAIRGKEKQNSYFDVDGTPPKDKDALPKYFKNYTYEFIVINCKSADQVKKEIAVEENLDDQSKDDQSFISQQRDFEARLAQSVNAQIGVIQSERKDISQLKTGADQWLKETQDSLDGLDEDQKSRLQTFTKSYQGNSDEWEVSLKGKESVETTQLTYLKQKLKSIADLAATTKKKEGTPGQKLVTPSSPPTQGSSTSTSTQSPSSQTSKSSPLVSKTASSSAQSSSTTAGSIVVDNNGTIDKSVKYCKPTKQKKVRVEKTPKSKKQKTKKDKDQKDRSKKDKDQKDRSKKDKDQKDRDQKEKDQKDRDQKEKDQKEKDQKEKDQKEKDQKEKDQKEKDQKDRDQKEKDQKDRDQKEKDQKEKGISEPKKDAPSPSNNGGFETQPSTPKLPIIGDPDLLGNQKPCPTCIPRPVTVETKNPKITVKQPKSKNKKEKKQKSKKVKPEKKSKQISPVEEKTVVEAKVVPGSPGIESETLEQQESPATIASEPQKVSQNIPPAVFIEAKKSGAPPSTYVVKTEVPPTTVTITKVQKAIRPATTFESGGDLSQTINAAAVVTDPNIQITNRNGTASVKHEPVTAEKLKLIKQYAKTLKKGLYIVSEPDQSKKPAKHPAAKHAPKFHPEKSVKFKGSRYRCPTKF